MLCSSYSGNTEETLAAYEAAGAAGAPRVVSASGGELAARARRDGVPVVPLPGGFQPRAAVGYSFVVALELAPRSRGAAPSARAEVEAAAELARGLAAEWGPDGDEDGEAKAMARRLDGAVPVVAGPGLAAVAAYRWKCQFNENAKLPVVRGRAARGRPQRDRGLGRGVVVRAVRRDLPRGPRRRRARGAARRADRGDRGRPGDAVERVVPRGETRIERLISHVLLGDLVSLYAAVLRGADPLAIEPIDQLKAGLART